MSINKCITKQLFQTDTGKKTNNREMATGISKKTIMTLETSFNTGSVKDFKENKDISPQIRPNKHFHSI